VVLALAANLLAERRIAVVERQLMPFPAAAPAVIAPASQKEVAAIPTATALPSQDVEAQSADLLAALEAQTRAVDGRRSSGDPALAKQYKAAAGALGVHGRKFLSTAIGASQSRRVALQQDLDALRTGSENVIALADQRRGVYRDYALAVDSIAGEVQSRLDGSWRIFGRVIARQQMVELRDKIDSLRKLALARSLQTSELAKVESAIAALVKPPPTRPRARRTGADTSFDDKLRDALDAMRTARGSLDYLDSEERSAIAARDALVTRLEQRIESIATTLRRENRSEPAPSDDAPPSVPMQVQLSTKPSPAPVEEAVARNPVPPVVTSLPASRSSVLMWISVAVLFVTLVISVLTVRSLVRQVTRLLDAIRKVARGESASVAQGGIRELDVLAAEFNSMSARLAQAREDNARYQQELELRVNERTAQLHHQASHDPLTELPNRRELTRLLNDALRGAAAQQARVGVLMIDLDHFKILNDSLGHAFGDRVLTAMAQRLRSFVDRDGFAARLGGDEFIVVTPRESEIGAISDFGRQLVRAFQRPLSVDGRELMLSVSVGASVYPDHQDDGEALLQAADAALFRAKAEGRSCFALYAPELRDAAEARFSVEQALRRAVDRGEFELLYQPEIELSSLEIRTVEALLRWRLPDGRLATPIEFLGVAEESGLMAEIGQWVLKEAIAAAARWYHGGWSELRVAINVSPRQLVDQAFVGHVAMLLKQHDLPAHAIELELTENVLQTGAHTIRTLHGLRELGVCTALDDFGTGYSSLASLENLPLTRVKLDRSLIEGIDTNRRSAAIARAIIALCDGLGLQVTAEGIERPAQFQFLMQHPSLLVQGYLLARPLPEASILEARQRMPEQLASLMLSHPVLSAVPHRSEPPLPLTGEPSSVRHRP
jgi:diguanylate cyclase (GGDEF)-like protein